MRRYCTSVLIDLALITLAVQIALVIREDFDIPLDRAIQLFPYIICTWLAAIIVIPSFGLARTIWRFSSLPDYLRLLAATLAIVLGAVMLGFAYNRLEHVARSLPILQGLVTAFLLIGSRVAFRYFHRRRRERPKPFAPLNPVDTEAVLVVGVNAIAELYLKIVEETAADRLRVVGVLGKSDRQVGRLIQSVPVLGAPEDLTHVLNELTVRGITVDRIVVTVAFDRLSPEAQEALLATDRAGAITVDMFAERNGLDVRGESGIGGALSRGRRGADTAAFVLDHDILMEVSRKPYWLGKRAIDIVGASVLLVALAPVMAVVALVVAIDVGGPVMFSQRRPGLGGHPFDLYKFRTMTGAYDARGRRIPDARRISRIGKFLRRSRLDELPQLVQILSGKMSFVGPRPLLPVDQSSDTAARLLVRPGMTGWAQVSGGRDISASDKAALDIWYVKNACFKLDLVIFKMTLELILKGERIDRQAIERAWRELSADRIYRH